MRRLIAALVLVAFTASAQEVDGGTVHAAAIVKGVISLPDGGMEPVYSGCWLSESRCIDVAKQRADDAERIKTLEASQATISLPVILACVGGALALGVAGGVVVGISVKK